MARKYERNDFNERLAVKQRKVALWFVAVFCLSLALTLLPIESTKILKAIGFIPVAIFFVGSYLLLKHYKLEKERNRESELRGGKPVLGMPPERNAFAVVHKQNIAQKKTMIDRYLVGFELDSGKPLWVSDDDICGHGAVFAKTGVGKTLWLESLMFQQMARGRASGCTFIDAKRDSATLAHVIFMAQLTGRIEDLIVVDPFDPVHSYNFCLTKQRADVKARKVLRAGLPPTSDQSVTKHYDRLAADSIYRMVRAMESFGLSWSIKDIAVALSAFNLSYPKLKSMLNKIDAKQAMIELGHLAGSYRTGKGNIDTAKLTENLRGISSELHAIAGSQMGQTFCTNYSDLVLTDAILRGKIIYFMLPRLEEAESAARMVKVFREDLEVSIGEVTSSQEYRLEDPHLIIVDEGSSTFGPTWANLFELARKGRFALLFGAQSAGGLSDHSLGLSEAFYERVMANVNLKVMMRVGDNRTATEMADWIGKVAATKKTVGSGLNIRGAGTQSNESKMVSFAESEEDLVSAEELKHEMSVEKGLAWFDLGDGRMRKGRSLWFNCEVPTGWDARKNLVRSDPLYKDEVGLADWVDEQILKQEVGIQLNQSSNQAAPKSLQQQVVPPKAPHEQKPAPSDDGSPYRLSTANPANRIRGRITKIEDSKS